MAVIIGPYSFSNLPTVTTSTVSTIGSLYSLGGGNVTSDGGFVITAKGVCWNTTGNPTIADSKTTNGSGLGSFTSNIRILEPGVTYYVRAYATNINGTSYGTQRIFTTKLFRVIKINKADIRLGDSNKTQEMLDLISDNDFNWIQIYDLNTILASNSLTASLATFVSKSRVLGVERVGAIRSLGQNRWNDVLNYNTAHPWYEKFDDFNIENEFWFWPSSSANPSSPTYPPPPAKFPESLPFTTWQASGSWLKSTLDGSPYFRGNAFTASGGNPWIISAYVQNYAAPSSIDWENGYATGSAINNIVDVYEATNYNSGAPNPSRLIIGGAFPQLDYIASAAFDAGITRSFVPIWSLEQVAWGAENDFSGYYFASVGLNNGESTWKTSYDSLSYTYKNNMKLIGYNYFNFSWVSASVGV